MTIKRKTGGKTVTITAAAKDGSGVKATYKITSMKSAVTRLTVTGAKKTLKTGKTMKLTAKVKALKAGKGKTVKITYMRTDGTNIKKVVKIKIK